MSAAMDQQRYREAKKITLISIIANTLIGIIKLIGGLLFHSHALVADAIHSISDLVTDAMVIVASRYGSVAADEAHPYGHHRIETAATLILSVLLMFTGAGIVWDSFDQMVDKDFITPTWLAIPIAILSIAANEALFFYTIRVGKRIHSALIITNAWHHRSDAASSLVVLIGLIGSMFGYHYFDSVAAIIVALMIIKLGWSYCLSSLRELVDTGLESDLRDEVEAFIIQVDGVEKVHQLRSRMMGQKAFIDVHIQVAPQISVSEGHYIAQKVHHSLLETFEKINDVTVHVDPEDDEHSKPSLDLPNRQVLEKELFNKWQMAHPYIQAWTLHYLDGKLIVELRCNEAALHTKEQLLAELEKDLKKHPHIVDVQVFCKI